MRKLFAGFILLILLLPVFGAVYDQTRRIAPAITITNNGGIRLSESGSNGSNYVEFNVPTSLPANISRSLLNDDRFPVYLEGFDEGASKGLAILQFDGTAFDGTTLMHNIAYTGGHVFMVAPLGAGQTLPPAMSATGLDIGGDQTDDEGYEIFSGVLHGSGRPFVIGTDPAFKFCATVTIGDVSGTDEFHIGFRRAETVNGTFDNYLDLASIGIVTAANPAAIQLETILNNGATTTTDTTDTLADATSKKFCVLVSAAGAVTYTNAGAAPTATAAFTFDDGDPVIPFIHFLNSSDLADTINITEWEVAYQ